MNRRDDRHREEVPLSYWKNAKMFSAGLFALVPCALALWFGGRLFLDRNARDMPRALMLLMSLVFSCMGLAFLALAAYLVCRSVSLVWRRDRLLLGEGELTCIARDGTVLTRIPYGNIEEVTLIEEEGGMHGVPLYRVGITLIDPRRDDTVLLPRSPLDPQGDGEWSAVIGDHYRLTPQQVYQKLKRKWERYR